MSSNNQETNPTFILDEETLSTIDDLKSISQTILQQNESKLSLPEVDEITSLIAKMIPAGNIPGLILNSLSRLPERKPSSEKITKDINALFSGIHQVVDQAIFSTFFAGPAAVIWGYQNLLKLAGKDADEAFPEGTWQFYVNYALREDTARHVHETHGFDSFLAQENISLSLAERMTTLTMTAIYLLHNYPDLLENEWQERVYIHLLTQIIQEQQIDTNGDLYQKWENQRPYRRDIDVGADESYIIYRKRKFEEFLQPTIHQLDTELVEKWQKMIQQYRDEHLTAYQQQMSISTYLHPSEYHETRIAIPLKETYIAIIYQGHYYLIPTCESDTNTPLSYQEVSSQILGLFECNNHTLSFQLDDLARTKRSFLTQLLNQVDEKLKNDIEQLRYAPIIINFDAVNANDSLAELRQTERGLGYHALTIFDTKETLAFDLSHIFFDGTWGATLAEIFTNEAINWATYIHPLPQNPNVKFPIKINFEISEKDRTLIANTEKCSQESSAETDIIDVKLLQNLRQIFKQRSALLNLTVNDLLILYRAIHALKYRMSENIASQLQLLAQQAESSAIALNAFQAIESHSNPTILIPMDASKRSPQDRLYPISFDVPITELHLLDLHQRTIATLSRYRNATIQTPQSYAEFEDSQHQYLAALAGLGTVFSHAKEIAIQGESTSVGTIKLLAHLPVPLQRLLDKIPNKFEILNDIIKGREVFSNIGAVAPTSSLTRFLSAKDDNERKTLAWGVMTDANKVMRITLRDFRLHVLQLKEIGQYELAQEITQHYLDSYAHGFNRYIMDLYAIIQARKP